MANELQLTVFSAAGRGLPRRMPIVGLSGWFDVRQPATAARVNRVVGGGRGAVTGSPGPNPAFLSFGSTAFIDTPVTDSSAAVTLMLVVRSTAAMDATATRPGPLSCVDILNTGGNPRGIGIHIQAANQIVGNAGWNLAAGGNSFNACALTLPPPFVTTDWGLYSLTIDPVAGQVMRSLTANQSFAAARVAGADTVNPRALTNRPIRIGRAAGSTSFAGNCDVAWAAMAPAVLTVAEQDTIAAAVRADMAALGIVV